MSRSCFLSARRRQGQGALPSSDPALQFTQEECRQALALLGDPLCNRPPEVQIQALSVVLATAKRHQDQLDTFFLDGLYGRFDAAFSDRVLILLQIYGAAASWPTRYRVDCELVLPQLLQAWDLVQDEKCAENAPDKTLLRQTVLLTAAELYNLLIAGQRDAVNGRILAPSIEGVFSDLGGDYSAVLALFAKGAYYLPTQFLNDVGAAFRQFLGAFPDALLNGPAPQLLRTFESVILTLVDSGLGPDFAAEALFSCGAYLLPLLDPRVSGLVHEYFLELVRGAQSPAEFSLAVEAGEPFVQLQHCTSELCNATAESAGRRLAAAAEIIKSPYFQTTFPDVCGFDLRSLFAAFKAAVLSANAAVSRAAVSAMALLLQEGAWAAERELAELLEFLSAHAVVLFGQWECWRAIGGEVGEQDSAERREAKNEPEKEKWDDWRTLLSFVGPGGGQA